MKNDDRETNKLALAKTEANPMMIPKSFKINGKLPKIKIKHKSLSMNNKTLVFENIIESKVFGTLKVMSIKKEPSVKLNTDQGLQKNH